MEGLVIAPFVVLGLILLIFRLWVCVGGMGSKPSERASGPVAYCAQCSAQFRGPDRMLQYNEHRMSHERDG